MKKREDRKRQVWVDNDIADAIIEIAKMKGVSASDVIESAVRSKYQKTLAALSRKQSLLEDVLAEDEADKKRVAA